MMRTLALGAALATAACTSPPAAPAAAGPASPASSRSATAGAPGAAARAPDFTLADTDGKPVTLSALLKDGPVILAFFPKAFTGG